MYEKRTLLALVVVLTVCGGTLLLSRQRPRVELDPTLSGAPREERARPATTRTTTVPLPSEPSLRSAVEQNALPSPAKLPILAVEVTDQEGNLLKDIDIYISGSGSEVVLASPSNDGRYRAPLPKIGGSRVTAFDRDGVALGAGHVEPPTSTDTEALLHIEANAPDFVEGLVTGASEDGAWVDVWIGNGPELLAQAPDLSVPTDVSGGFRLALRCRSVRLRARSQGRVAETSVITRVPSRGVELSLSEPRDLVVRVTTIENEPIAGARVAVGAAAGFAQRYSDRPATESSGVFVVTATEPDGTCYLRELPEAQLALSVLSSGFAREELWVERGATSVSVVLERKEPFEVRVLTETGGPAGSARVVILGVGEGLLEASTDSGGVARFDLDPQDPTPCDDRPSFAVLAAAPGHAPNTLVFDSLPDSAVLIPLRSLQGGLTGRLVVPHGHGLAEYVLRIVDRAPLTLCGWPDVDAYNQLGLSDLTVDGQGIFFAPISPHACADIVVWRGATELVRHRLDGGPLEIKVPPTETYSGRVLSSDLQAVREYRLILWQNAQDSAGVERGTSLNVSSDSGEFSFEGPVGGRVRVSIVADGFAHEEAMVGGAEPVQVVLRPVTDVEIRLVGPDGALHTGPALVELWDTATGEPVLCSDPSGTLSGKGVAHGGHVIFRGVPVTKVTVIATLGNPKGTLSREITLRPTPSQVIEVRID